MEISGNGLEGDIAGISVRLGDVDCTVVHVTDTNILCVSGNTGRTHTITNTRMSQPKGWSKKLGLFVYLILNIKCILRYTYI